MTEPGDERHAILAHVTPFAVWLLLMLLPGNAAWMYALRTVAGAGAFAWLRPWQWYGRPKLRHVPSSLVVGVVVVLVWIFPETNWFGAHWPRAQEAYLRFAVGLSQFGHLPEPVAGTPYAPAVCGLPLTVIRMLGSCLVIAVIEEFFWRGFLYRFLIDSRFLKIELGRLSMSRFLLVAALFGLEHDRWLVGIVAGLAYGLLTIRTRDLWSAVIAHVVTNLLLGLYVILAGAHQFWA